MGADPTASRVTGECSTVELQPQIRLLIINRVPMNGIEPLSKAYESFVLPLNYIGFCQPRRAGLGHNRMVT